MTDFVPYKVILAFQPPGLSLMSLGHFTITTDEDSNCEYEYVLDWLHKKSRKCDGSRQRNLPSYGKKGTLPEGLVLQGFEAQPTGNPIGFILDSDQIGGSILSQFERPQRAIAGVSNRNQMAPWLAGHKIQNPS